MKLEKQVRCKIVNILPPGWRKIADEDVEKVKSKIMETLKNLGVEAEVDVLMVDETAKNLVLLQKLRKLIFDELNKPVKELKHGKLSSYVGSYEKLCRIILDWIEGLALTRKERLSLKQQQKVVDMVDNMVKELMGM
ncbi:MAG: hypothetical protein ACKD6N_03490 [Candidatus Bathyarchaeota archaeon]